MTKKQPNLRHQPRELSKRVAGALVRLRRATNKTSVGNALWYLRQALLDARADDGTRLFPRRPNCTERERIRHFAVQAEAATVMAEMVAAHAEMVRFALRRFANKWGANRHWRAAVDTTSALIVAPSDPGAHDFTAVKARGDFYRLAAAFEVMLRRIGKPAPPPRKKTNTNHG